MTWEFDDATGKLTIGGTGDMRNYDWSVNSPWKDHTVTGVVIGSGVTNIGDYAFYQCYDLISVSIPESVTHIGNWAFSYCNELEAVNIPGSVNKIGEAAFGSCGDLDSVSLPDSIKRIEGFAFAYCDSLTSFTVPENVTAIGSGAFFACSGLTSLTAENPECEIFDSPETVSNGKNSSDDYYFNGTIFGYENSGAQSYAEKYGYNFESLGRAPGEAGGTVTTAPATVPVTTTTSVKVVTETRPSSTAADSMAETEAVTSTAPAATDTRPAAENPGDVDGNGSIDSSDASVILSYYAYSATGGNDPFTEFIKNKQKI